MSTSRAFLYRTAAVVLLLAVIYAYLRTGLAMAAYHLTTAPPAPMTFVIGLSCVVIGAVVGLFLFFGSTPVEVLISPALMLVAIAPFMSMLAFEAAK